MEMHDNLEEFQNPENYDLEEAQYVARPLAFYLALAEEFGSPILDIACGTGLYAYQNTDGLEVQVSGFQEYDPETQIMHWTTIRRFADSRALLNTTRINCKFTTFEDLNKCLSENGFRVLRQYRNWNKEPLNTSSSSIITVCALNDAE